jgi:hypothetical protein
MNKDNFETNLFNLSSHTHEINPTTYPSVEMPKTNYELTAEEIKKLNIPDRDEVNYPMPNEEQIREAGNFMLKLNLMASSLDGNLQAIIWDLYIKLNNFLQKDIKNSSIELAISLENLKDYLNNSNNPIFLNNK